MMMERKAAGHIASTPEVERFFLYNGGCVMVEKTAGPTQLLWKQRQMSASAEVTSFLPLFQDPSYSILTLTFRG